MALPKLVYYLAAWSDIYSDFILPLNRMFEIGLRMFLMR